MLVNQHADLPGGTHELHRRVEPRLPVKQRIPQLLTAAQHERIEPGIAERLIDGPGLVTAHIHGRHLGQDFPAARMQHQVQNGPLAVIVGCLGALDALGPHMLAQIGLVHQRQFETAEDVGEKALEMLVRDAAALGFALLAAEGDAQVVQREFAVLARQKVSESAQHPARMPDHDERQEHQNAFDAPKQRVNQPLPGARDKTGGFRGASHRFLCRNASAHATVHARSLDTAAFGVA